MIPTHSSIGAAKSSRSASASPRTSALSVWRKPILRVLLLLVGLAALGIVGRAAGAGDAMPSPSPPSSSSPAPAVETMPDASVSFAPSVPPAPCIPVASASSAGEPAHGRDGEATADDPVVLNTAAFGDLRRLPGVGAKRAEAILALRARLGRFHRLEDLLRVRGIGRASLRRLRPLVRIDPPAGAADPAAPTPPRP